MYYRGAAAAILVFDLTNQESFTILQVWVDELKENGQDKIILTIAGNKADLASERVGISHHFLLLSYFIII